MAEPLDSGADPTDKSKTHKQQRIMIIVGVVGLILTYILLRKSSGASSSSSSSTDQALAQYEQQNEADLSSLASQLQATNAAVAGITATAPTTTAATSGGTSTPTNPLAPSFFSSAGALLTSSPLTMGSGTTSLPYGDVEDVNGTEYEALSSVAGIPQSNQFFQPEPGDVVPYTGTAPAGTQLLTAINPS
jgi:hypothetical protein